MSTKLSKKTILRTKLLKSRKNKLRKSLKSLKSKNGKTSTKKVISRGGGTGGALFDAFRSRKIIDARRAKSVDKDAEKREAISRKYEADTTRLNERTEARKIKNKAFDKRRIDYNVRYNARKQNVKDRINAFQDNAILMKGRLKEKAGNAGKGLNSGLNSLRIINRIEALERGVKALQMASDTVPEGDAPEDSKPEPVSVTNEDLREEAEPVVTNEDLRAEEPPSYPPPKESLK
jgi:hypothetical protein